jgi:putative ABC transport system substrate-binding protein
VITFADIAAGMFRLSTGHMAIGIARRNFIAALGYATAWPFAALGQQAAMPVIGLLNSASAQAYAARIAAFRQGLGETGYLEGQNVAIEYQWAEGQYDRLPSMAAELVRRRVAVIAAITTPCALAAKTATTTIPIVFEVGGDPVELGLVASLNRPGGNLTGVGLLNAELGPKRLELLHELVPAAAIVAVIVNPANPNSEALLADLQSTAHSLGLELHVLRASSDPELEAVFATLAQSRAGALLIGTDPFFNSRSVKLAAFAMHQSIPVIYQYREFAAAGGLLSYGASFTEPLHLAGVYVGRLLKGEKPADLPVQQVTKVELIINLKTAKELGLSIPLPLLGRADEVIE